MRTAHEPWVLLHPPEVAAPEAPHGRRLIPRASLDAWQRVGRFPTAEACEAARNEGFAAAVSRARDEVGDAAAPLDLAVRRAVNARCVLAADHVPP